MQQALGKIYIQTYADVPTRLLKGVQHYKRIKVLTPVPHEILDPSHVAKLKKMAQYSHNNYETLKIEAGLGYVELLGQVERYAVITQSKGAAL